ncbi:MAG: zf-HC2 domain-containing protein [Acidobacteriota bacterium]
MSRHVEIEELSALLDGELEAPRASVVREHLAGCTECDQRRAGLERSAQTVRSLARAVPPADILQRVRRSTSALPTERGLLDRLGGWLHPPALRPAFTSVFALVFAAVLAVFVFHSYTNRSAFGPGTEKDDKLLEAYVRSGIPPGPSGRLAENQIAQSHDAPGAPNNALNDKDSAAAGPPSSRLAPGPALRAPTGADSASVSARQLQESTQKKEIEVARSRVDSRGAAAAEGAAAPAPKVAVAQPAEPEMAFAPAPPPRDEKAKNFDDKLAVAAEAPALMGGLRLQAKSEAEASPAEHRKQMASPRRVAGRVFDWDGAGWVERGIPADAPRQQVLASSAAGRSLMRRVAGLADLAGSVVVLRDRGVVVELRPGTPP